MRDIRDILKGVDAIRARRVVDVHNAIEGELGPVMGEDGGNARKLAAAQLAQAFFTAELRDELLEIHKAIYDGNPR